MKSLRTVFLAFFLAGTVLPVDGCSDGSPCVNGGTCLMMIGVKVCRCPTGFGGNLCQDLVPSSISGVTLQYPPCNFNICHNGGVCVIVGGSAKCRCPPGYSGLVCTKVQAPATTVDPSSVNCPALNTTHWPCGPAEVVFLMEYGGTDTGSTIDHEGDFFKNLIDEYKMDSQHVRVGVVAYHDTVREVIHLNDFENDKAGLKTRITQLNTDLRPSGVPDLAKALDYVRSFSFLRARPGVPKVVVSIVHMMPSGGHDAILLAAQRLKASCVNHYVNDVISHMNPDTLKQIASAPASTFYKEHRSFTDLEIVGGLFYNLQCSP